jgi:hypothetical protein
MFDTVENKQVNPSFQDSKKQDLSISRMPLKKIYTGFTAQQITNDPSKPSVIRITSTNSARVFCILCIIFGLVLFGIQLYLNRSWMILLGGALFLFIGIVGSITWFQDVTITIDDRFNKAVFHKKNLFKKSSIQDICLSDIKGIQLLSHTMKAGRSGWQDTDFDATLYEVNLVVNSPTNQRQFLYSHRKIHVARDAAEKIAIHLETTLLDHSDQKDIRE